MMFTVPDLIDLIDLIVLPAYRHALSFFNAW